MVDLVDPSAEVSTNQLTISLLGTFQVTNTDQSVSFATDRARALLTYLAVEADQPHRREALAALFWPDDQEQSARQNLSQTLTRVRHAIGDYDAEPPFLEITRPTLQLNRTTSLQVDLLEFQQRLAAYATHEHDDLAQCDACIENLAAAAEFYQGPFLEGTQFANSSPFEEWVLQTREQAQRQALDCLELLTELYETTGEHRLAQQYAARQLALEPWREIAHRQLMTALARTGQRGAALAQYESCRRLLADELAVEPEVETMALAEQIRSGKIAKALTSETADHAAPSPIHPLLASSRAHLTRSRLAPQHDQQLFGVATARARVHALLQAEARPWIIALDGIGGIGKTTLATDLAHEFVESERFVDIGWVSAKQEEFLPEAGVQSTGRPALDINTLTNTLLSQLLDHPPLTASEKEKQATLLQVLKAAPHLVVVDNLESVQDLDALIPFLSQLSNPTKVLLTSRFSRRAQAEIYSQTLRELNETDTLALLRHEADVRGINALVDADPEQLRSIYQVVGGNPLALKMVIGQVGFLPLKQVLTNLEEARGKRVDQLYTYIYWQAWQLLDSSERQLFLSLPLVPNATFDHLTLASGLDEDDLQEALARLIQQSLVQVSGDLAERHYHLHRLTETFLMNEVLKWQPTT